MGGFNETQHRRNPDGTFADMGNTRLKAACGTANARPDFSGIDLRERNFSFHDLSAADLHDADLRACEFWHTNLRGADLSGSDMRGAGLYSSDLSQADLSDVELRNATLANCDFHDADVSSTHWDAAAIVDCDFRGTGLTPDDVLDHMEERERHTRSHAICSTTVRDMRRRLITIRKRRIRAQPCTRPAMIRKTMMGRCDF